MNLVLIEDDVRITDFLRRGLRAEGYAVQTAATGPEGLALALEAHRSERQDGVRALVVLDLMLPGMNGLEICQSLRAQGVQLPS